MLASETCALDLIHAKFVRDVEPGEIVIINKNGLRSIQAFPEHERRAFCIFEYVYFARPDSTIANRNVYKVRVEMGRELAREYPIEADLVIPVPDSGNCAALGYSLESGIPYEMAFVRNHYVGRSFLQPSQLIRDFDVRVKLNLINELVKGKRVIVVDDSIVRGTTCKSRVNNLKEAGAKEVHVLVSCPPHMNPCVYGIDFPDRSKLMAANHSLEEIRKYLNADSLSLPLRRKAWSRPPVCRKILLHGLLRRQLSGAVRSRGGQAHHRTPQRHGAGPRRRTGPGRIAGEAAVVRPRQSAGQLPRPLQFQQRPLAPHTAAIAAQFTVLGNHPVARDHEIKTVRAVRPGHRADRRWPAHPPRNFFVACGPTKWNPLQLLPHSFLKRRPVQIHWGRKISAASPQTMRAIHYGEP